MNFLNIGKQLSEGNNAEVKQSAILDEAQNYQLADNGGYLHIVKYALFGMLALLNFRLFVSAIPDGWGYLVGLMAVMMEGFAIYCWNNQSKSSGSHRTSLIGFCIAFTVVSLAHGAASVYELVNNHLSLGPSIKGYVFWYSHVVAFPLIFGLMIFALFVIGFTHYRAKIAKERAAAQVQIEKGRADLATQTAQLHQQSELAAQQVLFYNKELETKMAMTEIIAKTLQVEGEQMRLIRGTTDPEIRKKLAAMLQLPDLALEPAKVSTPEALPARQYLAPPPALTTISGNGNFYDPNAPK